MINFYHGLIGSHVHFDATISELGAQCGVCHTPDLPYLTTDLDALVDHCQKPSFLPSVHVGNSLGVPWTMFKATGHQAPLDLHTNDSSLSVDEPPAYGLLILMPDGVVAHSEDVGIPKTTARDEASITL